MPLTAETLIDIAMTNPANAEIVRRLPQLGLRQCMLTAGCLFQAVWNHQSGRPAEWGIKDYDVFYFDEDQSWEAENRVILAAKALFQDLDANLEFKNQARVHRWYKQRFGRDYPKLQSAKEGIDRYLVAGTCIGLDVASGELHATYGLSDIEQGLLRINPLNHQPDLFVQKAENYRARWPFLRLVEA